MKELVENKPKHVDAFLEGGEGETFVVDAPFFNKKITIEESDIEWDGVRGVAKIKKAKLEDKIKK